MYDEIKKQGFFVKNTDGTPYVTQFWDGLGSYIDFTNPKGFEFWNRQVKEKLLGKQNFQFIYTKKPIECCTDLIASSMYNFPY